MIDYWYSTCTVEGLDWSWEISRQVPVTGGKLNKNINMKRNDKASDAWQVLRIQGEFTRGFAR